LVATTIFGTMMLAKRQRDAVIASSLVDRLVDAEISQVKNIIEDLIPYQSLAADDLAAAYKNSPDESRKKLHAALAMLSGGDDSVLDYLGQQLLTIEPAQFASVRDIMRPHASYLVDGYWQIIGDESAGDARAFQAACALATFDSNNNKWQDEEFATELAAHIVAVLPSRLKPWRDALRPVKANLTESLADIYRNDDEGEQKRFSATDTLAAWLGNDADGLFELLVDSNQMQFSPIFDKLTAHQERAIDLGHAEIAKSPAEDDSEDNKETLAMRQANAAVMLMRMNAPDQVWQLLRHSPDLRVRSYIIHWLGPLGGDPNTIMARYEQETDVTIKRALLLCLGEFDESQLPENERKPLIDILLTVYRSDSDSGLHGAAEWLLRKWGQVEKIAAVDKELQQTGEQLIAEKENERKWYVNGQGQTFTILDAGEFQMGSPESEVGHTSFENIHQRKIDRRFAISTKEVTKAQWREFSESSKVVWAADQKQVESYVRTDDSPMVGMTWFEAVQYCNWLSEQEGIPKDQWCYQPNDEGQFGPGMRPKENFLALTGYRLPTEAEWEFSCRAGARTSRYYGQSETLLLKYVQHAENSDNQTWPVAGLKPNDFGLFDMLGNTYESCYDAIRSYPPDSKEAAPDAPGTEAVLETSRRMLRGGSFSGRPSSFRSAFRAFDLPGDRDTNGGFRPARTYRLLP
jgi:formylglycine-generating enzyme required for sulfatase activity